MIDVHQDFLPRTFVKLGVFCKILNSIERDFAYHKQ